MKKSEVLFSNLKIQGLLKCSRFTIMIMLAND